MPAPKRFNIVLFLRRLLLCMVSLFALFLLNPLLANAKLQMNEGEDGSYYSWRLKGGSRSLSSLAYVQEIKYSSKSVRTGVMPL